MYALLELWVVQQLTQNKGSVWMHFSWVLSPLILSTFTHYRVRWTQSPEYFYPWLWVLLLIAESNQLKPLSKVYSAILLRITHYSYSVWMHWFTQFFLVKFTQLFLLCRDNFCVRWFWQDLLNTYYPSCMFHRLLTLYLCICWPHTKIINSRATVKLPIIFQSTI